MAEEIDLIAAQKARFLEQQGSAFDVLMQHVGEACESPIERVLLAALIADRCSYGCQVGWMPRLPEDLDKGFGHGFDYGVAQAQIGIYRVDFVIASHRGRSPRRVVIECDGHDFHEKTKEQAARDKQRDRYLQRMGFKVLRFTGSEIWRDAAKCAAEVFEVLDGD